MVEQTHVVEDGDILEFHTRGGRAGLAVAAQMAPDDTAAARRSYRGTMGTNPTSPIERTRKGPLRGLSTTVSF